MLTLALGIGGTTAIFTLIHAVMLRSLPVADPASLYRISRPLLIARYYVLTTASPAAGLWDWLRHGTDASWDAAEGTR